MVVLRHVASAPAVPPAPTAAPVTPGMRPHGPGGEDTSAVSSATADGDQGTGTPVVQLRGAGMRFGNHVLWDGLDLDIPAGQFLAILGPNGGGKSTLLK